MTRLSANKIALVFATIVFGTCSLAQTTTADSSTSSSAVAISSERQAIEAARAICGINQDAKTQREDSLKAALDDSPRAITATAVASEIRLDGNDVPFFGERLTGRAVWRVRLPGVEVPLDVIRATKLPPLNATIDLDANSGAVIQLLLQTPDEEATPSLAPYASPKSATEKMTRGGNELWQAPLDGPPASSLSAVLKTIHSRFGLPLFKEARINCVKWSSMGSEPRAAWSVHIRGFYVEFEPATGPTVDLPSSTEKTPVDDLEPLVGETIVPLSMRNHLRHIVLDKDLRWVTAGTTPQPERLLESEVKKLEERLKSNSTPVITAPAHGGK